MDGGILATLGQLYFFLKHKWKQERDIEDMKNRILKLEENKTKTDEKIEGMTEKLMSKLDKFADEFREDIKEILIRLPKKDD